MSFAPLGKLIGLPKSKAYHWFQLFHHPHIRAFMCWVELLPPAERMDYLQSYWRTLPILGHPRLAHSPESVAELHALLDQGPGLTIINGGTDDMRTFVVTALGHACHRCERHPIPRGIDFHRPDSFVPIQSLLYLDHALGLDEARKLILGQVPKILVSRATLLIFNRIWSLLPEAREDMLRCAKLKHLIVTDVSLPEMRNLKRQAAFPVRLVTLTAAADITGGIEVHIRNLNRVKSP